MNSRHPSLYACGRGVASRGPYATSGGSGESGESGVRIPRGQLLCTGTVLESHWPGIGGPFSNQKLENRRKLTKIHENPQKSTKIHENQRKSTKIHENPPKSTQIQKKNVGGGDVGSTGLVLGRGWNRNPKLWGTEIRNIGEPKTETLGNRNPKLWGTENLNFPYIVYIFSVIFYIYPCTGWSQC